ncbi:MAG: hypothetical protein KKD18_04885 [Nanoarchaeota archaeon]|nr:hypothetical protein [Nanoarchaeota archaeon]MBU0977726.1 hypothetical protein [Nanoarchaeota archaeon]
MRIEREYEGDPSGLVNVGNVKGDVPERAVAPRGWIEVPGLILKEYVMSEGEWTVSRDEEEGIIRLLGREVLDKKLNPLAGLGFAIISGGILNVCRWDIQYIDVVVPQIYTLEGCGWAQQSVEKAGAFCSGEKRVYDHENCAWLAFLAADRSTHKKAQSAKTLYLSAFCCV